MPRLEPESGKVKWYKSDGAKSVYASLISILIGLAVGMIVIIIVGLARQYFHERHMGRHSSCIPWGVQYRKSGGSVDIRL